MNKSLGRVKQRMQKRTAAGIVLYNPDIMRLKKNLLSVCYQVEKIFLVDNASENISETEKVVKSFPNCEMIKNCSNVGIAKALNQLFARAEEEKYSWLLTLDDDSVCDSDMVSHLIPYTDLNKMAIICPTAVDDKMNIQKEQAEKTFEYVSDCITAGSLTNVEIWKCVGGFDDQMFIDFVDVEYCTRLRRAGYSIGRVNNTYVHQEYGNIKGSFSLFGKKFYQFDYSPLRIYYSVRNQIYYMKKHKECVSAAKQIMFLIGYSGKRIVFESNRKESIKAILKGIKDGIGMQVEDGKNSAGSGSDVFL